MTQESKLDQGASALGIALAPQARQRLLDYLRLLHKWNKVYNLTAIREPQKMVVYHVLDSLAVLPYLNGRRVVDVGSGAGLPGVPLAIVQPHLEVTLLDSNHKKASFLRQVCLELGLDNAKVVCERVDQWQPPHPYDVVISRAFADLAEFARLSDHLLARGGALLAMKGLYPYEELAQLPQTWSVDAVTPLSVPGLRAQRHLVAARRTPAGTVS
jgi:16S rRNA (guanine527-N7)-methyltransferase